MSRIDDRLRAFGLSLPPPLQPPPGVQLPFQFVRILEHAIRFPDARRGADVQAKPCAPLIPGASENRIRGGRRRLGQGLSPHGVPVVEGQIKLQDVDHRLSEETELTAFSVCGHDAKHVLIR